MTEATCECWVRKANYEREHTVEFHLNKSKGQQNSLMKEVKEVRVMVTLVLDTLVWCWK